MEDLKIDDEAPAPVVAGQIQAMLLARETGLLGKPGLKVVGGRLKPSPASQPDPTPPDAVAEAETDQEEAVAHVCYTSGSLSEVETTAEIAEERFLNRLYCLTDPSAPDDLERIECQLGGRQTKSTFLVVFSPDRELMASTHGDHNIYVTRTSNGKCLHTLKGHPRLPWCVAFHPTHKGLLASGCLDGHVRVWDLYGDGSELWRSNNVVGANNAIASLTFHPVTRLLVIAKINELFFWDWKHDTVVKTSTGSEEEKVRYVKFDSLGHQLITGIANLSGGRDVSERRYLRRLVEPSASDMGLGARIRRLNNNPMGIDPEMTYGRYRAERRTESPPTGRRRHYELRRGQVTPSPTEPGAASASRTLSDLAAAASNRLMAENAAEIAASQAYVAISAVRNSGSSEEQPPAGNAAQRPNFSHSPESSFVEVYGRHSAAAATNRTGVYANRPSRFEAQERFRLLCERRRRRLLNRRLASANNSEDISNATRDYYNWIRNEDSRSTIDDWARLIQQRASSTTESNLDEIDVLGVPSTRNMVEPNVTASPESLQSAPQPAAEPAATAAASTPSTSTSTLTEQHNDHNYSTHSDQPSSSTSGNEIGQRQNLDLVLLSRHILHMQRICRASMADCAVSRHRRQIVRLQSIRRMLEDLQRQIRSLRNASFEELSRRSREAESLGSALGGYFRHRQRSRGSPIVPPTSLADASPAMAEEEEEEEGTFGLMDEDRMMDEANSLRHLGVRARHPLLGRATRASRQQRSERLSSRLARSFNRRVVTPRVHRMSRAHNQLVAQMRQSFRQSSTHDIKSESKEIKKAGEPEKEDDSTLGSFFRKLITHRKSKNGVGKKSVQVSNKGVTTARSELRALSQRLERMVRSNREESERRESLTTRDTEADHDKTMTSGEEALERLRREHRQMSSIGRYDPVARYRHLMDGIDGPFPDEPMPDPNLDRGGSPISRGAASLSNSDSESEQMARRFMSEGLPRPPPGAGLGSRSRRQPIRMYPPRRVTRENIASVRNPLRNNLMDDFIQSEAQDRRSRGSLRDRSSDQRVYDRLLSNLRTNHSAGRSDESLPRLQEIIFRRLRRRDAHLRSLEDMNTTQNEPTPQPPTQQQQNPNLNRTIRNREFLSWMVDQMRLDQDGNRPSPSSAANQQLPASISALQPAGASAGATAVATAVATAARTADRPAARPSGPSSNEEVRQQGPRIAVHPPPGGGPLMYQFVMPNQWRLERERERDRYYMQHTAPHSSKTHRIQSWDFTDCQMPNLKDSSANLVVKEATIHNDASVDISEDGSILVTLVPSNLPMTTVVGVFGLKPKSQFGRCYATCSLDSSAVSVSLSPTARHLIVGLDIRTASRIAMALGDRSLMAQVFRIVLPQKKTSTAGRGRLELRRNIHMTQQAQIPKLNCVKWIPIPGQGIVYATNTGLLKILR